jgi:hypothetical protein
VRSGGYSWPAGLAGLTLCIVLGLAIASSGTATLVIIALLIGAIVMITMMARGDFDIVLWLVTAAAFLLPMNNVRVNTSLTGGDVLVVFALLVVLVERTLQRSVSIGGMNGLLTGIVMIIGGGLLGSFFSSSIGASATGLARFGLATITLPVLFGLWRPTVDKLRVLCWSFVLGSSVSALYGILIKRVVGRAQGFTTHPNHLALASVMALGAGLGLAYSTGRRGRLVLAVLIPVLAVGTFLSGSRSGLVAAAIVVVVISVVIRDRKLILSSMAGVVALGTIVVFGLAGRSGSSGLGRLLGGGGAQGSDQARGLTIRAALNTILHHPVTGGGFQLALSTHEIILEVAATAGVFGVVGLLVVAWVVLRPLWSRYGWGRQRAMQSGDVLLIGLMAGVIGFYANGIFGNQLYDRYIWIIITMAVALAYELGASGASDPAPRTLATWR